MKGNASILPMISSTVERVAIPVLIRRRVLQVYVHAALPRCLYALDDVSMCTFQKSIVEPVELPVEPSLSVY